MLIGGGPVNAIVPHDRYHTMNSKKSIDTNQIGSLLRMGDAVGLRKYFADANVSWNDYLNEMSGAVNSPDILSEAANLGHHGLVELLLEWGANPNTECEDGGLAIEFAGEGGHADVVELLRPVTRSKSAIQYADDLLKQRANRATSPVDHELFQACEANDSEAFCKAIENGANLNATHENGSSILQETIHQGRPNLLCILIEHDVSLPDGILFSALDDGRAEAIPILVDNGVPVDGPEPWRGTGMTPLMQAAHDARLAAVEALLQSGASTTAKDKHGRTAFDCANSRRIRGDRQAVIDLLQTMDQ